MKTPIWHLISDASRAAYAKAFPYWAARRAEQLALRALRK